MIRVSHFRVGDIYNILTAIQTERQELIIEDSDDALSWHPYLFHYKPHELEGRPPSPFPTSPVSTG